jgi:two-component system, response regulator PdtaR
MEKSKILIVEDDKLLAMINERMLKRFGYDITGIAETGDEAIREVLSNEPDIILMDVSLKGEMDGFDAVREIRKRTSAPVIFVSGISGKEKYNNLDVSNIIGFLPKPVNGDDLIESLQKAVDVASRLQSIEQGRFISKFKQRRDRKPVGQYTNA